MKSRIFLLITSFIILTGSVLNAQNNFWEKIGVDTDSKANSIYISSGGDIYVGSGETTDGGAMFLSADDGDSWSSPYDEGGPGVSCLYVADANTILIGTGSGPNGVIKLTTDGGTNWNTVHSFGMAEVVTSFVSTSAGLFASSGVYNGTSGNIIFSDDEGETWSDITSSLGAVMAMAANDDGDLYIGNHNGDVYKSENDGGDFTQIRTGSNKDIGSIFINSSGDIYIGVEDEGVYRSINDGSSWTQLNYGLGDKQVSAILQVNDTLLFAGTTLDGVFRTTNSGANWSDVTRGLGWDNVGGGALKLYNNYIYCGVGDGIYKSSREATDIPEPPSPPKNLAAEDGEGIVTLTWEVSDSASADVVYRIYRRTAGTNFSLLESNLDSETTTEYEDDVNNDVQYFYYMTAYDNIKALESDSTSHVGGMSTIHDPVPPAAPDNLTAETGDGVVVLSWDAVQASPVHYRVFRSTSSDGYNFTTPLAEDLTSTTYTDNSVTNDTRYYYVVDAINDTSDLDSRQSNEVSVMPRKPDPEPPSNLQVEVQDPNIVIWWEASITQDITEYRVYRSTSEGTGYELLGTETPPSTTYTDDTGERETSYYYIVKAWDDVHESQATNEVNGMLETLTLDLHVTPASRYTVDRFDNVFYNVMTMDQGGSRIAADLQIQNGVTGDVENVQTDASGYYMYTFEIPGDQEFSEYTMTFTATKADYDSDIEERQVTVVAIPRSSSDWAYVYTEDDAAKLIYAMADTNNKWFSPGEADKINNDGFDIVVNGFLLFQGDMTIDTLNNEISSDGKWYVNSPSDPPTEYVLLDGQVDVSYSSNTMSFGHNESNLQNASMIFGTKLYPDAVGFVGGLYASGISLNGYFYISGVKGGCDNNPVDEISFEGLIFDENGLNMSQTLLPSLSPDPAACFENFYMAYDANNDRLILEGDFTIPWLSVRGLAYIQGGEMSTITLSNSLGMAADIGLTGMTIRNVGGTVSGITQPPMEMTLDGTLVSASPDYIEVDIGGVVHFPQKIDFNSIETRIILEPTYGNWQIVGPMTGMMNITSHLDVSGDMKAGTIDGDLYVVEGTGNLKYTWNPEERLRGGIKGDITVTDFPDEFPYDLIEMLWEDEFPVRLHNANVFVQDRKVMGNLHFGGLIGSLNFTLDLDKVYGDEGFLTVGSGAMNMNGIIRKDLGKDDEVQAFDPYQLEGQSMPIMLMKKDETQAIVHNDTLNLTGGMDKVFIRIMSDTQVPGSYLMDPSGGKHTSDDDPPKDTNVVFKNTANGKKGYWVIKDGFEEGEWISGTDADDTDAGDYRDVFATFDKRDIELVVLKDEDNVSIEWNNTAIPAGPYMEFYLGLDTNDINGLMIGSIQENTGEFSFAMSDTLPECLYYLYVLRYEDEKVDRYYSTEDLWNNKGNLMSPDVLSSVYYGGTHKLVVSWDDPNTGDNIQGYLIRLTYTDGTEEIIARPYAGSNDIEIDIEVDVDANPTLEIAIAAYTEEGFQSCWSVDEGVTVDVEDYPLAGFENEDDRMSIFPNPLSENTNIRFRVAGNSNIRISVYDLLGNEIAVLANDYYGMGIYDVPLNSEGYLSGTYYVKYQSGDVTISKLMVIAK
ncbi:T9SS type A sorting domain-containing protein [Bacteroidota bacterium]